MVAVGLETGENIIKANRGRGFAVAALGTAAAGDDEEEGETTKRGFGGDRQDGKG